VGFAPAVQRTLVFDRLRRGEVNRARAVFVTVGGKAVNTALALVRLGRPAVVAGINGGASGRRIRSWLRAAGVACAFTPAPQESRTCTTVAERVRGTVTELVEEAPAPPRPCLRRFERDVRACLRRASWAVFGGAVPAAAPVRVWARLAAAAARGGVPVLLDSRGSPLLAALRHRPLLVKLNADELAQTWDVPCRGGRAIVAAARRLTSGGAQWALVTQGAGPAWLVARDGAAWRVTPPRVRGVRSPVGSGDCVNAGIAHALLAGRPMPEAVRFGLACGTANALTWTPADFAPPAARRLARACRVEPVK
jgi:1-phosphofructokinase family hexose kinase